MSSEQSEVHPVNKRPLKDDEFIDPKRPSGCTWRKWTKYLPDPNEEWLILLRHVDPNVYGCVRAV